jgi:hypothetical protein
MRLSRWDGDQERLAGGLAPVTGRGAHGAVLMMVGVLLALSAAESTGFNTQLQLAAHQVARRLGVAREHAPGHQADIGAVQVEAYAADEHLHFGLAQASIGAGCAALRAVKAGPEAGDKLRVVGVHPAGMRLEYVLGEAHGRVLPPHYNKYHKWRSITVTPAFQCGYRFLT